MSVVGPKSTADVAQFLGEATGLPILGCAFERTPDGYLTLRCEYKDRRGEQRTKRLALGNKFVNPADEVVDLAVVMSEWLEHGEGHMLDLLNGPNEPLPGLPRKETVQ